MTSALPHAARPPRPSAAAWATGGARRRDALEHEVLSFVTQVVFKDLLELLISCVFARSPPPAAVPPPASERRPTITITRKVADVPAPATSLLVDLDAAVVLPQHGVSLEDVMEAVHGLRFRLEGSHGHDYVCKGFSAALQAHGCLQQIVQLLTTVWLRTPADGATSLRALHMLTYMPALIPMSEVPIAHASASLVAAGHYLSPLRLDADVTELMVAAFLSHPDAVVRLHGMLCGKHAPGPVDALLHSSVYRAARYLRVCARAARFRSAVLDRAGVAALLQCVCINLDVNPSANSSDAEGGGETRISEDLMMALWEAIQAEPASILDTLMPAPTYELQQWLLPALWHPSHGVALAAALLLACVCVHPETQSRVSDSVLTNMYDACSCLHASMMTRVARQSVGGWPSFASAGGSWIRTMCSDDRVPVVCVGVLTLACAASCARPSAAELQSWMPALDAAATCGDAFVYSHLQWIRHASRLPLRPFVGGVSRAAGAAVAAPRAPMQGQWVIVTVDGSHARFTAMCVARSVDAVSAGGPCVVQQLSRSRSLVGGSVRALIESTFRGAALVLILLPDECCTPGSDERKVAYWDALALIHAAELPLHFLRLIKTDAVEDRSVGEIGCLSEPFLSVLQRMRPEGRYSMTTVADVEMTLHHVDRLVKMSRPASGAAAAASVSNPSAVRILPVVPAVATGADQIQAVCDLHAIAGAARRHGSFIDSDFRRGLNAARSTRNLLHELRRCEIWHFTGHGDAESPLHFARREPNGRFTRIAFAEADLTPGLAAIRRDGEGPMLILLMGCNTGHFAYKLAAACANTTVIAWATALSDAAANAFCELFYDRVACDVAQMLGDATDGRTLVPAHETVLGWLQHAVSTMREQGFAFVDPTYGYYVQQTEDGTLWQLLPVNQAGRPGLAAGVLTCILPASNTPFLTSTRLHLLHWPIAPTDDDVPREAGVATARGVTDGAGAAASVDDALSEPTVVLDVQRCGLASVAPGLQCLVVVDVSFLAKGMTPATDLRRNELARLASFVVNGVQSPLACGVATQLVPQYRCRDDAEPVQADSGPSSASDSDVRSRGAVAATFR